MWVIESQGEGQVEYKEEKSEVETSEIKKRGVSAGHPK